MIDQKNIKEALSIDVALSSEMINALTLWVEMYENSAGWLADNVLSLNLPAAIAAEIARTVTIEMEVDLGDGGRAEYLAEQLEPLMDKIRTAVEFGCAKGGLIFKPWVLNDEILVDVVQADQFYPVNFDSSGNITSCVFVDQRLIGKYYYTRLERHDSQFREDPKSDAKPKYLVQNKAYRSEAEDSLGIEVELNEVPDWAELESEAFIEGIDFPLYAYFKYPLANNIDTASPLGVSCYSRATDQIKQADLQWTRLMWEFESGERALYVDVLAFGKDSEGDPVLPHKKLYRTLETGSMEGDFFQDWSPELRRIELAAGLNDILKEIEFTCGLAYGTISDPQNVDKTATEIKTSKQRSAATITDTQKSLEKALTQLLEAMDAWCDLEGLGGDGDYEPVFTFDDSIIVDKDTQLAQDLQMVTGGIMSKVEFRMRNFNEDEETAKKKVKEAQAEAQAAMAQMFGEGGNNKNTEEGGPEQESGPPSPDYSGWQTEPIY